MKTATNRSIDTAALYCLGIVENVSAADKTFPGIHPADFNAETVKTCVVCGEAHPDMIIVGNVTTGETYGVSLDCIRRLENAELVEDGMKLQFRMDRYRYKGKDWAANQSNIAQDVARRAGV